MTEAGILDFVFHPAVTDALIAGLAVALYRIGSAIKEVGRQLGGGNGKPQ